MLQYMYLERMGAAIGRFRKFLVMDFGVSGCAARVPR
jgi:hypothetical protein